MNKPPKCRNCNNQAVLADAGLFKSIPYWYCRHCKYEVDLWGYEEKPASPSTKELDDYLGSEMDRFEHVPQLNSSEQTSSQREEQVTIYDPFLKRNRPVPRSQAAPREVDGDEMDDEDDEDLHWSFGC